MIPIDFTLAAFEGRWSILREIIDEKAGRKGRLEGQVVFRQAPPPMPGLIQEERGDLKMEGTPALACERRYHWRAGPDNTIAVSFEDGRPFHRIDLNCTMPFDTHVCTPDFYEVTYDFRDWPTWRSEWRVRGPRKDYRLCSRYRYMGSLLRVRGPCEEAKVGAQTAADQQTERGETWRSTQPTGS